MAKKVKLLCTICKINSCDSDLWCSSCYIDYAVANGVYGSEAIKAYKKENKKVNIPMPKIVPRTQAGVDDDNLIPKVMNGRIKS